MLYESGRPFNDYIDTKAGTVDRIIFSDQAIYEMELERIFARCWNFMCHESQIPNKGDFFLSFIGEESVICTRDKTGALQSSSTLAVTAATRSAARSQATPARSSAPTTAGPTGLMAS